MKNRIPLIITSLSLIFLFGTGLLAQEKTEVFVKVKKEGKVVKDTMYQFDDEAEAKNAIQVMELMSGEEKHMEHIMAHSGEGSSKAMVFISEDGKTTHIEHLDGDSLVWVSEDDHAHGEHVVIVKSGDGETFDILLKEGEDGKKIIKKEVTVIVSDDEGGTWTVDSDELKDDDENVFVIKGDGEDVHVEIEELMKEHGDGENVKVIVIKKDKDHDHDVDHEGDKEDKEVEVKVVKKKVKKEEK